MNRRDFLEAAAALPAKGAGEGKARPDPPIRPRDPLKITRVEQVTLGEGYLKKPFTVRNGYVDVPTGPGLGIELDDKALAKQIGHNWRNRETYDEEDGSVVDW